jgi:hypothetical protein
LPRLRRTASAKDGGVRHLQRGHADHNTIIHKGEQHQSKEMNNSDKTTRDQDPCSETKTKTRTTKDAPRIDTRSFSSSRSRGGVEREGTETLRRKFSVSFLPSSIEPCNANDRRRKRSHVHTHVHDRVLAARHVDYRLNGLKPNLSARCSYRPTFTLSAASSFRS